MGAKARPKPKKLAKKLARIREALGLSQNQLIRALKADLTQSRISDYESGVGEPSLPVILGYAQLAGICTDVLLDDGLDLPDKLPSKPKHWE
jgi:transcriptional regulator with XRE-family HTH domain